MSFVQNFTATQQIGLPSVITLTDTSTGSDVSIVSRKVYIQTAQGTYLVNGEVWSYVDDEMDFDVLDTDQAVNIRVDWLDASNNVLYSKTTLYNFTQYNSQFSVDLTRAIASNPAILGDNDYWMNKIKLRVNIDDSDEAVSLAGDIYLAQAALDRATYLQQNESLFF